MSSLFQNRIRVYFQKQSRKLNKILKGVLKSNMDLGRDFTHASQCWGLLLNELKSEDYNRLLGLYCRASARWLGPMISAPSRSAMVRASLRMSPVSSLLITQYFIQSWTRKVIQWRSCTASGVLGSSRTDSSSLCRGSMTADPARGYVSCAGARIAANPNELGFAAGSLHCMERMGRHENAKARKYETPVVCIRHSVGRCGKCESRLRFRPATEPWANC